MLDDLRSGDALYCAIGVVRLFGSADIGARGMLGGWAGPEDGHNWNEGAEAVYALALEAPPTARLALLITGEPYVTRVRPSQELTLFGNGLRIGFWRLTMRTETTLTTYLEPEWWLQRGGRAIMQLAFYLPDSVRPKDIADGPDGREIGFCFRSLLLAEVPA